MRLIDADALIKDIAESVRFAYEWEKESYEKKDKLGIKMAVDTRRSLLSMISRIKEAPTIEPEVRHGRWIVRGQEIYCSECNEEGLYNPFGASKFSQFCPNCGTKMYADGGTISKERFAEIMRGADNG